MSRGFYIRIVLIGLLGPALIVAAYVVSHLPPPAQPDLLADPLLHHLYPGSVVVGSHEEGWDMTCPRYPDVIASGVGPVCGAQAYVETDVPVRDVEHLPAVIDWYNEELIAGGWRLVPGATVRGLSYAFVRGNDYFFVRTFPADITLTLAPIPPGCANPECE